MADTNTENQVGLVTVDGLEAFKSKQDMLYALTFLANIVYDTLPTTNNYEGQLGYSKEKKKLYIYIDGEWKEVSIGGVGDIPTECEEGEITALFEDTDDSEEETEEEGEAT